MNLLSGTTWKGAKLRIGEAKPDFRERYDTSYFYKTLSIDRFVPTSTESNTRTKRLQMTDRPKGVVWREAFKAFTPQTCPSLLLKPFLHDPVGTLHLWVGSFVRCECDQESPFHLCPP